MKLKNNDIIISRKELGELIESIGTFLPGFVNKDGDKISIKCRPERIMEEIQRKIQDVPNEHQQKYLSAFSSWDVGALFFGDCCYHVDNHDAVDCAETNLLKLSSS